MKHFFEYSLWAMEVSFIRKNLLLMAGENGNISTIVAFFRRNLTFFLFFFI